MERIDDLILEFEVLSAEELLCKLVSVGMDKEVAGDYFAIIEQARKEKDAEKIKKTVESIGRNWPKFIKDKPLK